MARRIWLQAALAVAILRIGLLLVAIETGVLVEFMATPSDWQPQPMPELRMRCASETDPIPWEYCVHHSPGSASGDLLVYFHGRRGNARWWNDATYYTGELYTHWRDRGTQPPTVVSISFGPLWVLSGENGAAFEGVIERSRDHAVDWAGHDFDRLLVVGESMGGYNALLAGLDARVPVDKVAALCPPLSATSPFGTGVLGRLRESAPREAFMLFAFSRAFFHDEVHWRHTDPVARVSAGESFEPALHLSCGEHDPWGCQQGGQVLVDTLRAAGQSPQWQLLPQGHCAIDSRSLADFLGE